MTALLLRRWMGPSWHRSTSALASSSMHTWQEVLLRHNGNGDNSNDNSNDNNNNNHKRNIHYQGNTVAMVVSSLRLSVCQPRRAHSVVVTKTQTKANSTSIPSPEEATTDTIDAASNHPTITTTTTTSSYSDSDSNKNQRLHITDSCWRRVEQLAAKKSESSYLRIFVDAGGCSGFSYKFEWDTAPIADDDIVYQHHHRARIVVDQSSLDYMQGSTIDFVQELIKSSFEVKDNPQSESACGCGSSFALKKFAANPARD